MMWVCLILLGCGAKENSNAYEIPVDTEDELKSIWYADRELLYEDFEDHYTVYKWEKEQTGIESPYGICVLEDAYYVNIWDAERTGIGRPYGICAAAGAIYICKTGERDTSHIVNEPLAYPWYLDVVDDDHIYAVDSLWKTVYYFEKKEW